MKLFFTFLICLCVFLLLASALLHTNYKLKNFNDFKIFAEANRGDNGDPLPLPPNPPPPPPPGLA